MCIVKFLCHIIISYGDQFHIFIFPQCVLSMRFNHSLLELFLDSFSKHALAFLIRFFVLHRIKPHALLLVRVGVDPIFYE